MSSVDVFVPRTAPGRATLSISAKTCCFSASSSNTASMITSAVSKPSSVELRMDAAEPILTMSAVNRPRVTEVVVIAADRIEPAIEGLLGRVVERTSRPAFAHAMAMPLPIVPAPMMARAAPVPPFTSLGMPGIFSPPARRRRRGSAPSPVRCERTSRKSAVSRAQPFAEGQAGGRFDCLDRHQRRRLVWLDFLRRRPCRREQRRVDLRRAELVAALAGFPMRSARRRDPFGKLDRTVEKIAVDHFVDDAVASGHPAR